MFYLKPAKLDYFVKSFLLYLCLPASYIFFGFLIGAGNVVNTLNPRPTGNYTMEDYGAYLDSKGSNLFFIQNIGILLVVLVFIAIIVFSVKYKNNVGILAKLVLSFIAFWAAVYTFVFFGSFFIY